MQTFCPLLIGLKESEASRCGPAISSWMSETWEADVLFFFLLDRCIARDYGEGVSKTERKKRIHQAGPWALFGEGVGAASPHAGSGRCRRLMRRRAPLFKSLPRHRPAMDSGGVQLLPAGQKFSGPGAGALGHVWLHAVFLRGSLRMAESTSVFWGGFLPPPLNGCLVSHLLYKTFMPFQKWALSCVVWLSWFLSQWFAKSASSGFVLTYSNSTPVGEGLAVRGTSFFFFGRHCLDRRKGCFPQSS